MPQPRSLKITEIFASVQGEGLRQGEPTVFVRLSGCNLRCSSCDTKYAWTGGQTLAIADIVAHIEILRKRFPAEWVCLTGGEPMLQAVGGLVSALKKSGWKVQVETNGTVFKPMAADWWTVSPKPKEYLVHPGLRPRAREVKLIVTRGLTFDIIRRVRKEFPPATPILLQPESHAAWSVAKSLRLINRTVRARLRNIRLSVQLHKIFRVP
jgi:7-carboxy-7-deazaguanine synthase